MPSPARVTRLARKPARAKGLEFKVKDLSLAEWGRKEIELAEKEMPGLMGFAASTPPGGRSPASASRFYQG